MATLPMRILIADDDAVSRRLLKLILESVVGTEVTEAEDGLAAWSLLHREPLPDVCFLDHLMPGMNGLDLLERMRSDAHLLNLPVVMCTACSARDIVMHAANLRARHFIIKPYNSEVVLKKFSEVRAEFIARQPLQDAGEIQKVLGVSEAEYNRRLSALLEKLPGAISSICVAIGNAQLMQALAELPDLKQACSGVGANGLLTSLAELEAALLSCDLDQWKSVFPLTAARVEKLRRLMTLLQELRLESARLESAAKPAPGAELPDGPAKVGLPSEPSEVPAQG